MALLPPYDVQLLKRMMEEKEKEWRTIAELRAERAEEELKQVQTELVGEREKLDKVKADFSYNLKLLAGRDSELDFAEKTIEQLRSSLLSKERELSELKVRSDKLFHELETERKCHSEQIERLRQEQDKQSKKQMLELSSQQAALKISKDQLEERLREVEETFSITRRQLEEGFQEETDKIRRACDTQLDEVRGQLIAVQTEARLLAKELEFSREIERKKKTELLAAENALEMANQQLRQMEWDLADKSSITQTNLKEFQQRIEEISKERESEKILYEQRIAHISRDLADKVMLLERMQRCRFDDAGEAGKKIGEMQGELVRLRASADRIAELQDELRAAKESAISYHSQMELYELKIKSLTEANAKLESSLENTKSQHNDEFVQREIRVYQERNKQAEEHIKKLLSQNETLKEAVRQMKADVEAMLSANRVETANKGPVNTFADGMSQTEPVVILIDNSSINDEEIFKMSDIPGDPRLRAYVESLIRRTSSLQHRCTELVAEGRRQQIKAESASNQLDSVEKDCQKLRSTLEHTRYELSAERSRFEADKLAAKKQIADLEERLAEARVVADEFHAEANNANAELGEIRRRLANQELAVKSANSGVGFGGQELYIQQLEDQIKEFATRAKPQDSAEANARLKRAIAIIVQLQKDRTRLLDLAARLRATAEDYRLELENSKQLSSQVTSEKGPQLSTRSNLRPQNRLDKLETLAYEEMREKLANQMADPRGRLAAASPRLGHLDEELADLSTSFPNSEAIHDLFQQIDYATAAAPSSARSAQPQQSPKRLPFANNRQLGSSLLKSPMPSSKGRGRAAARIWAPELSPPPTKQGSRLVRPVVSQK